MFDAPRLEQGKYISVGQSARWTNCLKIYSAYLYTNGSEKSSKKKTQISPNLFHHSI